MRKKHGYLQDEQGDYSLARVLCLVALLFTFWLVIKASDGAFDVPLPVWALLTSVDLALIGWAAGPRIMRYLGPQIGAAAQGVASAGKRLAGMDNSRTDDERG